MTKLPRAPAHISAAINRLAKLRLIAQRLRKQAAPLVERIAEHGPCRNKRYRAYVIHVRAALRRACWQSGATRVSLKPIKGA